MTFPVLLIFSANIFTIYPGFLNPEARVQVATDKGPVVELVIACKPGEGIMSFSKVEKLFCVPDSSCYRNFNTAYRKLCQ